MVRRALSAAVGVVAVVALLPTRAAASSEPVTKIAFTLDATEVPAWTNVTGDVVVTSGAGPFAIPLA